MTDDDPPPIVDRNHPEDVAPAVLDFLEAMKHPAKGTETIDPVVRKVFEYKVSVYLSISDPSKSDAVRNKFAKWLNEFSQYQDLKGANLQVTNCKDEFLLVPSLLHDDAFQKLTGWEKVKSGPTWNVHLCVKMKSAVSFSRLKHRMKPFLFEHNIFMKRNQSLGDSTAEMATIGYLAPVHPDLLLENIQLELNKEIQCMKAQQEEDYLVEHGVRRGVIGELVIAHGAVRGSSKQHGDVINSKAVVVECPKNKAGYFLNNIQEALRTFQWSPDMKKVKFVPFALKADPKTKDVFTNMIVYNSMENSKKAYAQILGVSSDDMGEIRDKLISDGPNITHVEPTRLAEKQGRWRIYTTRENLDTIEKWLKEHLPSLVDSISMRIPVPGFETPRLVSSNRVSQSHVQDIAAIAKTVPNLEDAETFPNLVVKRGRVAKRKGAWQSSSPLQDLAGLPIHVTPSPTANRQQTSRPTASSSAPSPALRDIGQQLEANRKWRVSLEAARQEEKQQQQELSDTVNTLRRELDEIKTTMKKQYDDTAQVLGQLTAGQTELHRDLASRDQQQADTFTAMRADITALTASVRDLFLVNPSASVATPPRLQRTDSDTLLFDSSTAPDLASLGPASKRSLNGTPSKQNPRVNKTSRTTEGMIIDEDPTAHHP
jgi:hypothetical protein